MDGDKSRCHRCPPRNHPTRQPALLTGPLTPAIVLLAASALLLAGNLAALARVPDFAWGRFFEIGRWALLAYIVIAG
ncbi:MAG: hypothetical protein WAU77_10830 [Solirubrobacteraceae bacterium]